MCPDWCGFVCDSERETRAVGHVGHVGRAREGGCANEHHPMREKVFPFIQLQKQTARGQTFRGQDGLSNERKYTYLSDFKVGYIGTKGTCCHLVLDGFKFNSDFELFIMHKCCCYVNFNYIDLNVCLLLLGCCKNTNRSLWEFRSLPHMVQFFVVQRQCFYFASVLLDQFRT